GLVLAALAACAVAQKDKADKDKDKPIKAKLYKTPEECFEVAATAVMKRDGRLLLSIATPKAQKQMAADSVEQGLYLRALAEGRLAKDKAKGVKNEQLAKAYRPFFEVLDKHGLTEEATKDLEFEGRQLTKKSKEAALKLVKDPIAFAANYMDVGA